MCSIQEDSRSHLDYVHSTLSSTCYLGVVTQALAFALDQIPTLPQSHDLGFLTELPRDPIGTIVFSTTLIKSNTQNILWLLVLNKRCMVSAHKNPGFVFSHAVD